MNKINIVKRNLKCKVCGDAGIGFSYKIVTCESCKVFFHRNAHSANKLVCKNTYQNCTIDLKNRKKCRHCRLAKCFALGMVRENGEAVTVKQSIEVFKKKQNLQFSDQVLEDLFTKLPTFLLSPFTERTSFTCGKRAAELNDFEKVKIAEVMAAFAVVGGDELQLPVIKSGDPAFTDVYDTFWLLNVAVKMAIKFCKGVEAFSQLKKEDQFVLLKPFIFSYLMIRFAWSFNFETNSFTVLKDESATETVFIPLDLFNTTKEYTQKMTQFTRILKTKLGDDIIIRNLCIAFTMFIVTQKNDISNPEIINYQNSFYSRLLLRYLESKTKSVQLARKKFLSLLNIFEKFPYIRRLEKGMIMHFDEQKIPQVVAEVYDLNL